MCDEHTVDETNEHLNGISRRQFNTLAASAAVATLLPQKAYANNVNAKRVDVPTPHGVCDAFAVSTGGKAPVVLMWPDILALRPAFRNHGHLFGTERLRGTCVNPYYRDAKAPVVEVGESFQDQVQRTKVMPMYRNLSAANTLPTHKLWLLGWMPNQRSIPRARLAGGLLHGWPYHYAHCGCGTLSYRRSLFLSWRWIGNRQERQSPSFDSKDAGGASDCYCRKRRRA